MKGIDRRGFFGIAAGAAGALAGSAVGAPVWARGATAPGRAAGRGVGAAAGFHRFALGDVTVTVLSDGWFRLPKALFGANVTAEERAAYYETRALPTDYVPFRANPVVLETRGRRVLVDSGTGVSDDPEYTMGRLLSSMSAAGIDPAEIDLAVVTHAHSDHIDGLLRRGGTGVRFPNAEVVVSDTEHGLWTAADVERRVPQWVVDAGIVEGNRVAFRALGDRIRTVPMDGDIGLGLRSVATPGHTSGHIAVVVEGGSEPMAMVGDALVTHHSQVEHPEWTMGFDQDQEQGVRTRRRLLDMLASERMLVQGFHFPFPGVGRVLRDGSSYRWLSVA